MSWSVIDGADTGTNECDRWSSSSSAASLVVGISSVARKEVGDITVLWKLFKSSGVNGDTHRLVVAVVGNQPLQCSFNNSSPDSKVAVGPVGSFPPQDYDI